MCTWRPQIFGRCNHRHLDLIELCAGRMNDPDLCSIPLEVVRHEIKWEGCLKKGSHCNDCTNGNQNVVWVRGSRGDLGTAQDTDDATVPSLTGVSEYKCFRVALARDCVGIRLVVKHFLTLNRKVICIWYYGPSPKVEVVDLQKETKPPN